MILHFQNYFFRDFNFMTYLKSQPLILNLSKSYSFRGFYLKTKVNKKNYKRML